MIFNELIFCDLELGEYNITVGENIMRHHKSDGTWLALVDIAAYTCHTKDESIAFFTQCIKDRISRQTFCGNIILEFINLKKLLKHFPKLFERLKTAQNKPPVDIKQHLLDVNQIRITHYLIQEQKRIESFYINNHTENNETWFVLSQIFTFCKLCELKAIKKKTKNSTIYYEWGSLTTCDFIKKNSIKSVKYNAGPYRTHENCIRIEDFCRIVPEASQLVMDRIEEQKSWR